VAVALNGSEPMHNGAQARIDDTLELPPTLRGPPSARPNHATRVRKKCTTTTFVWRTKMQKVLGHNRGILARYDRGILASVQQSVATIVRELAQDARAIRKGFACWRAASGGLTEPSATSAHA